MICDHPSHGDTPAAATITIRSRSGVFNACPLHGRLSDFTECEPEADDDEPVETDEHFLTDDELDQ